MVFGSELLSETLTYWQLSGHDGYGTKVFTAPILIKGRVFTRTLEMNTGTEERMKPQLTIYADRELLLGSYIAEGDASTITNPLTNDLAYAVKQIVYLKGINPEDILWKVLV